MSLLDFVKAAGRAVGIGTAEAAPSPEDVKKEIEANGLGGQGIDVKVDGDKVTVSGKAASQEEREKIVLAAGNIAGVAKVDDQLETTAPAAGAGAPAPTAAPVEASTFYTVKKGDTLSAIAKSQYRDAGKYHAIFEANKPMLKDPDKIYPGQVLRIPPLTH